MWFIFHLMNIKISWRGNNFEIFEIASGSAKHLTMGGELWPILWVDQNWPLPQSSLERSLDGFGKMLESYKCSIGSFSGQFWTIWRAPLLRGLLISFYWEQLYEVKVALVIYPALQQYLVSHWVPHYLFFVEFICRRYSHLAITQSNIDSYIDEMCPGIFVIVKDFYFPHNMKMDNWSVQH